MNNSFMRVRLGLVGILAPMAMLLGVGSAYADSVQISPASVDYTIEAGNSLSYNLQVRNQGTEPLGLGTAVTDFYYDETGDKVFVEGGVEGEERFSLKTWITADMPDNLTLAPGEYVSIPVTIDVPEDAEPGGHYGVIFFTMQAPDTEQTGGATVGVSGRIGALVLVDVPGLVIKDASVEHFKVGVREGNPGEEQFYEQSSFESGPLAFEIAYHNKGTTHFFPEGTIAISGGFMKDSWTVDVQPASREEKVRALPRVTKNLYAELNQRKLFGKYTATLQMQDGNGDQLAPITIEFWVMPIKTVLLWALLVVVVVILLTVLVKRYNRWISSKARSA